MIDRLVDFSAHHRFLVLALAAVAALAGWQSMTRLPLDAVPDIGDTQIIIYSQWDRPPELIEAQVTQPIVSALLGAPHVKSIRGVSDVGASFVYVILEDDADLESARARALESLSNVLPQLPEGVKTELGPDATGLGWIFQYVLTDSSGAHSLADLRSFQDWHLKYSLKSVAGVAEVATVGGFVKQYQVNVDPSRLRTYGLSIQHVADALKSGNHDVGGRVVDSGGAEFVVRGLGSARSTADLEQTLIDSAPDGTPIRINDVARVSLGSDFRRGVADLDGQGEAVSGIVVMRQGENALDVIDRVKARIRQVEPSLPPGMQIVPVYDRSDLIRRSISTVKATVAEVMVTVAIVILVFLWHIPSVAVPLVTLPLAVLIAFIPFRMLGIGANIMSLGGITIAVGALVDAAIVVVEQTHKRLERWDRDGRRGEPRAVIVGAIKQVARPSFFALLVIAVSFLPILTLQGEAGRLFKPLAYGKSLAMLVAAVLAVTLDPALRLLFTRVTRYRFRPAWLCRAANAALVGEIRPEEKHPLNRAIIRLYEPVVEWSLDHKGIVFGVALLLMVGTIPAWLRLGTEFMPSMDEGALLYMPNTMPGISVAEAGRLLQQTDRVLAGFPEVARVLGKSGRADSATDPAPLSMFETVVMLRPPGSWRRVPTWYSSWAPEWVAASLRHFTPDHISKDDLVGEMNRALTIPGVANTWSMPIRGRVDMLTTGVRTPVGIKVFGQDLKEIERVSVSLEGLLRQVPGTRSTFAERQTSREYIDIVPNRGAIARYGLTVRDVQDVVEAAVGGMSVSTAIAGRSRFSINLRYAADQRSDPQALRRILVPVQATGSVADSGGANTGAGASTQAGGMVPSSAAGTSGGMGSMGGGGGQVGMRSGSAPTGLASPPMGGLSAPPDFMEQWRQPGAAVPLGELADVRVTTGPPMIKDENGVLVGYVFADIDQTQRDLGGWVDDAKTMVASQLALPAGYRLQWTGQYEFLAEMEARLRYVIPLTLVLVVVLLYLSMRGWPQTFLVLSSLPFAVAGSVWLLAFMHYSLSTAVWVGLIAVAGVAAETGIVMVVYLDEAFDRYLREGRIHTPADVDAAVVEGASARVRPLIMTVATTVLGLLPLLWEAGFGADVSARTAAPVVGGLWSCMFLTLLVLPAAYAMWRRHQVRVSTAVPVPHDAVTTSVSAA